MVTLAIVATVVRWGLPPATIKEDVEKTVTKDFIDYQTLARI